ncbi:NAD(P)H-dependent glycerol-3-phosphate dehydrogenase [Synechococcales cyanobacterium C]|uniref:Glycerol-3-phosphate dehydrogenase [NAD(P)+] n=2 Tax=Petrachloros TaxID=2918834 RepID=A0A8K2A8R9_9CYAN|nr:NAD(P)H-dependent glycerol-3-phosphate dehydrogenase [Petrachloros mirabilis]NCJ08344.1 NAD(P)H-dependent glycerol-3-phosphate dehydrogenase [Petrachloros mirabilis ULC683]
MISNSPVTASATNSADTVSMTILGTGAWGSALAALAEVSGHHVQTWSRHGEQSLADSVAEAEVIVIAISMKGVPEMAKRLQEANISKSAILVSATKGLDPETLRTPSQIWQASFPDHPIVVLSGPNLSKEIERGMPAATVVASEDQAAAETVQQQFASEAFRVYTNPDRLGTELGGTLKNVIAIAVGVCDGLKLGDNARAALVTRALPELIRVGTHLGGQAETFFGLSGLGDLLATCTSPLSRNYQVGYQLAHGKSLEQILTDLNSTAEGVNTANVLIRLANQEKIPVPISRQVYRLLNGKITPQQAVEALMERDLKSEDYDELL